MSIIIISIIANKTLPSDGTVLRCETEVLTRQKINERTTVYTHAELHYVVGRYGKGLVNIYGSATENSTTYLLSRTLYFSYVKIDDDDIYEIHFHDEIISKTDNTPEYLADYLSFSTKKNNTTYVRTSKINEKLIILNRLSSPMVMCKKF